MENFKPICRECKTEMRIHTVHGLGTPSTFYCFNEKCSLFGLLTVVSFTGEI